MLESTRWQERAKQVERTTVAERAMDEGRELMPRAQTDRLLSIAEVAELIGLSAKTIYSGQCGTDELIRIRLGRRLLFSFNDVQAWMARKASEAAAEQAKREDAKRELLNKVARPDWVRDSYLTLINGGQDQ